MIILLLFFTSMLHAQDSTPALQTRGTIAFEQKKASEAKECFQQLLDEEPHNKEALKWLGIINFYENKLPTAVQYLKQAYHQSPQDVNLCLLYAMACNHAGQFTHARSLFEALHDYDRKLKSPWIYLPSLYLRTMEWYYLGKFVRDQEKLWWYNFDITHKTVLLDLTDASNGYGDVIQTIRYAQHLHAAGASVICKVKKELIPLLSLCPYLASVIAHDDSAPETDYVFQLNTMLCMARMKDTLYSPSQDIPYLFADSMLMKKWKSRCTDAAYKIGICWQSSPQKDYFSEQVIPGPKSVSLEELLPLLRTKHITWYSLQKNADELITVWNRLHPDAFIHHYHDLDITESFMDSAALIAQCDLIISVDTAIAHLAGAMGKPVWLILSYASDFRWLEQDRTDSPLYPTMRLFRQHSYGNWHSALSDIMNALSKL